MKIRLIILLILTGAPNWISAQIGMFYTTDNELLSSSLINSIYQDSRNYIWIATEDGINKYDGVKFVTYKNRPDDSSTIQNNYVHSLLEDSFGRFWIGCINALHRYDRMSNQFTKIPVYDGKVLIYPHITNIIESKNHEVWMTTSGHGVIRIKPEDTTVSTDYELSKRLSSMHLTAVFEDSKGRFWIASEYNGLNLYNPVTNEVQVFKQPQIGSNQISSICEDKQGNIFVGTLTKGLFRLNIHTQQFELIPHTGRQILSVKCLMIDNNGRLLVGTDGQGIKIFNEEKQYLDDKAMLSAPFDLSKMKVHALLQDKSGNIWMGLFQKGVFLDPANSNQFNYLGHRSFHRNVIGMSCVMSLLKDKSDNLWVGTDNDGVYKIDRQNRSQHFAPAGNRNSAPNTVFAMIEDEKSNIWMGSYLQGLSCLNPQNGQIVYYNNYFDVIDDNTARNKIFCMTKDQQNRLWIGTNGAGIYVFDLQTKKYIAHYSQRLKNDKIIPNDWINCIRCNGDGTILAGSYGGFFSIHPETNRLENHIKNGILPGNVVYCINEDENGNLWIGTTEGLACFDRKKGVSSIYTTENGLPSNVICALVNDGSGNLWISTHQGISKMKIASREFVNYFVFDGLQGNEFSMGSAFKSKDGELFFGGTSGVTSFYPAQINDQKAPLNIYLTGLYLGDKQVVPFQKSGKREIFKGYISDADTICFSYDDNIFGLEFSTFDFGFSERVSYQYILEGLNSQWISTEPGVNRINFTNLNYGTYRLKIKASIYANSSNEKDITLIILPPWYLSGWAKSAYLLLFILLIYGVTIFIRNQMRQRSELLRREYAEQISEAKLQFFINISHEIRTPMTLIINPIERLVTENKDPKLQEMYLLIYRNAQRILQLINQLMDVRKIDKGQMSLRYCETDIVGFTDDLMQTFKYQATKNNIRFSFIHSCEQLNAWIDMNQFDKVLVNILSNAFKFTPPDGEITVRLQTGDGFYEIIVSDTGPGIEEDKIEKIFERFYQINTGVANTASGTGVGLHLARSLVELQHGTLVARNRTDGSGSEFIIRLPLGNTHLNASEMERKELLIAARKPESILPEQTESQIENTGQTKAKRPKTKYRVLIADDEEEIRLYLKKELSGIYHVSEAANGKEALNKIMKDKPDLIISDIMMPVMDGIALTKKIKSNINVNQIPIILLSAKAGDNDKAEGFDMGADAYISKPFNMDLLKKIVGNIFENRERLKQRAVDSEENKALIKPIVLKPADQLLYEKIIKKINENIANPELNVEFLAGSVGMSRVHLHRKLKELTNQSAHDFIRSIRLNQAAQLLSNPKLGVSDVAYALGFVNLSHFSNAFREFHGVSPKEYRENAGNMF